MKHDECSSLLDRNHEIVNGLIPATRLKSLYFIVGRIAVTAVVVSALIFAGAKRNDDTSDVPNFSELDTEGNELMIGVSNEYPQTSSLYPWRIVEPHRETTVYASSVRASSSFKWEIRHGDEVVFRSSPEFNESSFKYTFTSVAGQYQIDVTETCSISPDLSWQYSETFACKYVRREMRSLKDDDREAYLAALEVVARTGLREGRELYGEKFINLQYLTVKHVYGDVCTPYHSGLTFFTSHAAFTMQLDQALQTVDPTVATPFWDYTLDAQIYGSHWENSEMFNSDWFGPLTTRNANHEIEGRFAKVPVPQDYNFSEHNSYGTVTHSINNDPSLFVTRDHSFCGLNIDLELPGCDIMMQCLETKDLVTFHHLAEDELHGNLHNVIGGFFDCGVDMSEITIDHSEWHDMVMDIGLASSGIWARNRLLSFPESCSRDTAFEDCKGLCRDYVNRTTFERSELVELLSSIRFVYFTDDSDVSTFSSPAIHESYFQTSYHAESGKYSWRFDPDGTDSLSDDENTELMQFVFEHACGPGRMGAMSTGAAANDPIFWPIHPTFDRIWHYIRLDSSYSDFDHTWQDDPTCYGRSYLDVLPFKGLFGEENATHFYSNKDLYSLLDPKNPDLPHVYENFDWDHCSSKSSS